MQGAKTAEKLKKEVLPNQILLWRKILHLPGQKLALQKADMGLLADSEAPGSGFLLSCVSWYWDMSKMSHFSVAYVRANTLVTTQNRNKS